MAAPDLAPFAPAGDVHTLSLYVNNKPGVLVRVALVFARRGFNIESLVVSPAAHGDFSRMTIVCRGERANLEQIVKQLQKLVDVVQAIDHTGDQHNPRNAKHDRDDLAPVQTLFQNPPPEYSGKGGR